MATIARQYNKVFPKVLKIARHATIGVLGGWGIFLPTSATIAQPLSFPPSNNSPSQQFPDSNTNRSIPALNPARQQPDFPENIEKIEQSSPNSFPAIASPWIYRVELMTGNPLVFARVQSLVPDAFVRQPERIIQAGAFSQEVNALQLTQNLALQGISSRVVRVESSSFDSPTQTPINSFPGAFSPPQNAMNTVRNNPTNERGLFVVIPESSGDLVEVTQKLLGLGVQPLNIQEREQPFGKHLAIGPFESREAADRWNALFRSHGLDARLHRR
ncbi:hypothetical protein IQ249_16140 [Lusitaniella coriacea LEGE 07157]|uniref:SPOR domain-containing protein n=1 Tax=Lusitaniella coriacea LEGE 07157 TaxID=945747 RepID=A0A8J7E149_9CYAN|nr:SPOR domain-containing protein [Lusitaniella coriacea]MBE9117431.1 hypothetical protein [Lusitaniella coriacea LEGE 07157]